MAKHWNIKALLMGFFICIVLSMVATYALAIVGVLIAVLIENNPDTTADSVTNSVGFYGVLLLADLACYLAGGLTIARMAKGAEVRHAAAISGLAFIIGLVLVWWSPPENQIQSVVNYISFALTLVPIAAAYYKSRQY